MRALFVLVSLPILHLLLSIGKTEESVGVEALRSQATAGRFYKGVSNALCRSSIRPDSDVLIEWEFACP